MVAMGETARILNNATQRSLVILDEIGRGTSTYDGLALAWAITEHLAQRIGCRGLFATHYHELTDLADRLPGVANRNVAVREELRPKGAGRDVVFLYKILPGATDRSYGIHVAGMAGLPGSIIKRSEVILRGLEAGFKKGSRSSDTASKPDTGATRLPLFPDEPDMPNWWRDLVDAVAAVDVEHTMPIEALSVLQKLQATLRKTC